MYKLRRWSSSKQLIENSYSKLINVFEFNDIIYRKFLTYIDHHNENVKVGFVLPTGRVDILLIFFLLLLTLIMTKT